MEVNKYLGNQILGEASIVEDCKNRICVTDKEDELRTLFCSLLLHAASLYQLNQKRISIQNFDLED